MRVNLDIYALAVTIAGVFILGIGSPARPDAIDPDLASVFHDLTNVAGDLRAAPVLRVVSEPQGGWRIAWFDPAAGRRAIYLEQQMVDVCRAGDFAPRQRDCIALILGHELAHFYKDHSRLLELPSAVHHSDQSESSADYERQTLEAQADEVGGYYAAMGGYRSFEIADEVLAATYKHFKVPSDIPGYPSLEARRGGLAAAKGKLAGVMPVFEAGAILFLTKHYLESARCFDQVSRSFPSREILNDSGAARLLAALQARGAREAFSFPVEMDAESRLMGGIPREAGPDPVKLAARALASFDRSIAADSGYVPALVNRALALIMLARNQEALGSADHAREVALGAGDESGAADAMVAHGIAAYYLNDAAGARRDFVAGASGAPLAARADLRVLDGAAAERTPPCTDPTRRRERIGEIKPEELRGIVDPKKRIEIEDSEDSDDPLVLFPIQRQRYGGYVIELKDVAISALVTSSDYSGCTARGVCAGAKLEDAGAQYSCPEVAGNYNGRTFVSYPSANLILDFGPDKRLRRWITFVEDKI